MFAQHEVPFDLETSTNYDDIPAPVTDSHMKPVVVLEKLDLTR